MMDVETIVQDLNSPDPELRRRAAEVYFMEPLTENELAKVIELLSDSDKGVRDAAGMALSFNENPAIPSQIVKLISSHDIALRNLVCDILLRIGVSAIPSLIAYLPDSTDDDAKFIIDIMGLIGDPAPANVIIGTMKSSKNENVLLACAEALGNIKYADAIQDLIEVYKMSELYGPTVIEAFGKIGSPEAAAFIMENYAAATDLTKFSMLESIGDLGDESSFYFLLTELRESEIPYTWAIILSLKKLCDKYDIDIPYDELTKSKILSTLCEGEKNYKLAASSLIISFRDEDVLKTCLEIFGNDSEIDTNILPYLCKDGPNTLRLLMDNLSDRSRNLRALLELLKTFLEEWNGSTLSSLQETEIVSLCDSLSYHLSNPDEEVRKLAMELLFMIKPDMAIAFFEQMVSDNILWNRLRLIELLEVFTPDKLREFAGIFQNDSEEMIRDRIKWILASGSSDEEGS